MLLNIKSYWFWLVQVLYLPLKPIQTIYLTAIDKIEIGVEGLI